MGFDDKIQNKAEEATGKVKEEVGDKTDNERLESEGRGDQSRGGSLRDRRHRVVVFVSHRTSSRLLSCCL